MDSQQSLQQTFTPGEVAALVGASLHNIRRWCDYHAAHLSPGAHPAHGATRRLTRRDIEVMRAVKQLRSEGLTVALINERLAELRIGEIDNSHDNNPDNSVTLPTLPGAAPPDLATLEALRTVIQPLQSQLDDLRQRQAANERARWDVWIVFGAGVITAALFFLIIVLLLRLGT